MNQTSEQHWRISRIETETDQVANLYLEALGIRPVFIAGQYLTVKLPGILPTEGKAYSISSSPHEAEVRLSVKRIGKFSAAILAKVVGDEIVTSLPYGFFYPEPQEVSPLVFVVGGIGITPCLSIIKDLLWRGDKRKLFLYYSNQTKSEIAFFSELENLVATYPNLEVKYYVTREESSDERVINKRMQAKEIAPNIIAGEGTICFICGAMDFTKALWRELHQSGIPRHQLYTEGFF